MNTATKKLAKAVATELQDMDRRSLGEQMAVWLSIGQKLQEMIVDEATYGANAVKEIAGIPGMKNESHVYAIRSFAMADEPTRKFIVEQTAIPMSNGQPLTLEHWNWLMSHKPRTDPREQERWLLGELAWLRTESPSAAVLNHVEVVSRPRSMRRKLPCPTVLLADVIQGRLR